MFTYTYVYLHTHAKILGSPGWVIYYNNKWREKQHVALWEKNTFNVSHAKSTSFLPAIYHIVFMVRRTKKPM